MLAAFITDSLLKGFLQGRETVTCLLKTILPQTPEPSSLHEGSEILQRHTRSDRIENVRIGNKQFEYADAACESRMTASSASATLKSVSH